MIYVDKLGFFNDPNYKKCRDEYPYTYFSVQVLLENRSMEKEVLCKVVYTF